MPSTMIIAANPIALMFLCEERGSALRRDHAAGTNRARSLLP